MNSLHIETLFKHAACNTECLARSCQLLFQSTTGHSLKSFFIFVADPWAARMPFTTSRDFASAAICLECAVESNFRLLGQNSNCISSVKPWASRMPSTALFMGGGPHLSVMTSACGRGRCSCTMSLLTYPLPPVHPAGGFSRT